MTPRLPTLLMLAAAHEDIGMYPSATMVNGERTPRTEWQDGWNAACMDISRRWCRFMDWYRACPEPTQALLVTLLEQEALGLSEGEPGQISVTINMNDTFVYACAESEEVPLNDLPKLAQVWEVYGQDGLTAYAAHKRGEDPLPARQGEAYHAARAFLQSA